MRKRLIAIALTACFTPIVAPQNTRAQVVESMVGGSACAASVGCGVVVGIVVLGGVAYYVLKAKGRKYRVSPMEVHAQPIVRPGPRPEFHSGGNAGGGSGETFKLSTSRQGCKDQHKRMREAGYQVDLRIARNPNWRNGATEFFCYYSGRDAWKIPRFWR